MILHAVIVFIAFALLVALSCLFMAATIRENMVRDASSILAIAEVDVVSDREDHRHVFDVYAASLENMIVQGLSRQSVETYIENLPLGVRREEASSNIENLYGYLRLSDGPLFISTSGDGADQSRDPNTIEWYKKARASEGAMIETKPVLDESGEMHYTLARCLRGGEDGYLGVICVDIAINGSDQQIINMASRRDSYGMLISEDFVIMAHEKMDFIGKKFSDPDIPISTYAEELRTAHEITERPFINFKGEHSVAFAKQISNGWYLGLSMTEEGYYASVNSMVLTLIVAGLAFAITTIILVLRLDYAREKASTESEHKAVFLANMSHEIRTPLNAILGITEVLVQDETLRDDTVRSLTKIYSSSTLLLGIVNDILDFSKIEADKLNINAAPYQIAGLVNDSIALNIMRTNSKPIEFVLEIDENLPANLIGDEIRIKQILNNLLSNAFKYTDRGTVTLRIGFAGSPTAAFALRLEVQDTGQGMTKIQTEKLFEEFTRFQISRNRTVEGTGLGMPITHRLVQLMRGDIYLESEPDKGSLFIVTLPQAVIGDEVVGQRIAQELMSMKACHSCRAQTLKMEREPMPYGKVLVVDDVETNVFVAEGLMKLYGIRVDTAMSGYEALSQIRDGNNVYDVVFMDHMMPGM
ncbi:MAG TPA: hypothetical protein DEB24_02245, partial [Coriobacteriia bacterium]|nr:hypothetical protein [Coriobacteriia bacterium]